MRRWNLRRRCRLFDRSFPPTCEFLFRQNGDIENDTSISDHVRCPFHTEFKPFLYCYDHPECVDPFQRVIYLYYTYFGSLLTRVSFFKALALASTASKSANENPVYALDYKLIAGDARRFAARLLNACESPDQVSLLLRGPNGDDASLHSRLLEAVDAFHIEVIGHEWCQHVFEVDWKRGLAFDWNNSNIFTKSLYCLQQVILTPLYIIFNVTKDNGYLSENLDVAFNRFISFHGWNLLFLFVFMADILQAIPPFNDWDEMEATRNEAFFWRDYVLAIYGLGMLWQDLRDFARKKVPTTNVVLVLWPWTNFVMHLTLIASLAVRFYEVMVYPCPLDPDLEVDMGVCETHEIYERHAVLDTVSSALLSTSAALAVTSNLYWLQLLHSMGPLIISFNRVLLDVLNMLFIYLVIMWAFTLCLANLLFFDYFLPPDFNSSTYLEQHPTLQDGVELAQESKNNQHPDIQKIISTLFWAILNPGPAVDRVMHIDGARDDAAAFALAFYQVLTVIIFLNLVIALMNATVQRLETDREVVWKSVRMRVRAEFFKPDWKVCPPFSALAMIFALLKLPPLLMRKLFGDESKSDSNGCDCRPSVEIRDSRRNYAHFMQRLIGNVKSA